MRAGAVVAVGAVLLTFVLLPVSGRPVDESASVQQVLAEVVAEEPDLPIVVPTRWRDEWGAFVVGSRNSLDDDVTHADYRIMPTEASEPWAVGICVVAADAEDIAARFEARRDDVRPARPCEVSEGILAERLVDGMPVVVYELGLRSAPGDWTEVALTADWHAVDWIDDVHEHPGATE